MQNTKALLDTFKDYETLLRSRGTEPKLYEDTVEDFVAARLRMCRMFRNYLAHQKDPGFLEVTDKMAKWFSQMTEKLRMDGDTVKKHMKTLNAAICSDKDKCADILSLFRKLKTGRLLVVNGKAPTGKDICQCVFLQDIAEALAKSKAVKVSSVPHKPVKCLFMAPGDNILDVPDSFNPIIVTENGTKEGKAVGIISLE